mgnify:CR=1 FL=1
MKRDAETEKEVELTRRLPFGMKDVATIVGENPLEVACFGPLSHLLLKVGADAAHTRAAVPRDAMDAIQIA